MLGIRHFMNGPESFTPDTRPLLGESPYLRGFYVAAGFNSTGMMSSAGAGRAIAEWIVDGEPRVDLWPLDIARFDLAAASRSFVATRMEEAVADLFRMHWPYKQPTAGRDLRRSAFHGAFAAAGAVFGAPTGWERPLWFASVASEKAPPYSFGRQYWWSAATSEATRMAESVGLFELSPFTKLDIAGRDAASLMHRLCANDVEVEEDRAVYTQMLNERGGIEADVTVTRCGENAFRVVSGAASRQKDRAWIERRAHDLGMSASVFDATSAEAVLGVMGPRSRELLQTLTDADLSDAGLSVRHVAAHRLGRGQRTGDAHQLCGRARVRALHTRRVCRKPLEVDPASRRCACGLALCGLYALEGAGWKRAFAIGDTTSAPRTRPSKPACPLPCLGKRRTFSVGRPCSPKGPRAFGAI